MFGRHVILATGLALLTSWSAQAQTMLYVNEHTLDLGAEGLRAIETLTGRAGSAATA